MGTPPGTWAAMGIHAKALWTLQVSMTALSGDITLPLVSRWFGTSRGLGEGRLSTPVGYPLRQPWTRKHTAKRVCVSVTVPALGAGPGPVLAADGRCAAYARRRPDSARRVPRTCSDCRARSCSHQGSAGLITCLSCWMRCLLGRPGPPRSVSGCRLFHPLPPLPRFLSVPRSGVVLGLRGVAAEEGGSAASAWARWSIRGLGIHPAHPRTVPDRIVSGGLMADATPPPLIRLPDSCGRGLEASTTTQSVPLQALQPAAWCMV